MKEIRLGEGAVPSGPLRCANGLNPWIVDQNDCYKRPNKLSISKKNRTKMCFRTFWATNFLEFFSNFVLVHRINWKICQPNLETKNAISREYWPFQNWKFQCISVNSMTTKMALIPKIMEWNMYFEMKVWIIPGNLDTFWVTFVKNFSTQFKQGWV